MIEIGGTMVEGRGAVVFQPQVTWFIFTPAKCLRPARWFEGDGDMMIMWNDKRGNVAGIAVKFWVDYVSCGKFGDGELKGVPVPSRRHHGQSPLSDPLYQLLLPLGPGCDGNPPN